MGEPRSGEVRLELANPFGVSNPKGLLTLKKVVQFHNL